MHSLLVRNHIPYFICVQLTLKNMIFLLKVICFSSAVLSKACPKLEIKPWGTELDQR